MGQLTGVGSAAKPSICGAQHSSGPSLKVSIHCQTQNRDSWHPLVAAVSHSHLPHLHFPKGFLEGPRPQGEPPVIGQP